MIEEIKKEDLEEMVQIYMEAFNSEPWNDNWTNNTATLRLDNMLNDSGFYGIKILEEGKIQGFLIGHEEQYYDGIVFNIKEICVRKIAQGKSIGSKLVDQLENIIKTKGIKRISLMTIRAKQTLGFYNKKNYKLSEDLIYMEKTI